MKLSLYKEDVTKQESGSPLYIDDGCFYVKRVGTAEYHKQIEELKKSEYGFAPKEVNHNLIFALWLSEYGITGWEGVLDEEEYELEFSRRNARIVFNNPAFYLGLNALLMNHGSDYANYLFDEVTEDIEQIKKN